MPVSTFFGLQTSLRGLLAHQRALDVTGHNVANASTPGFSRQEAVLGAAPALLLSAGAVQDGSGAQLGAGVDVLDYRRVRDGFLDLQYRAQAMVLGDAKARSRSLEGVELALAEPGTDGLSHQLGVLWSSFATLANAPESTPARQVVVDQAKTVATAFADLDRQLESVRAQAEAELGALTAYDPALGVKGEVGALAEELVQLGESIRNAIAQRQTPNDLLDRRDAVLDRLSTLGQVTVVDNGDGGIRVLFGGTGDPLVDDSRPPGARIDWPQTLTAPGGRLGALIDLSAQPGGVIATYRAELAVTAQGLADTVNALHDDGPSNRPLFAFDPTRGAAGLSVLRTPAELEPGSTGAAGANDVALALAALRGGAIDSRYASLVARIGSDVKANLRQESNSEVLLGAVEDRRQAVAGVSLDEEMTNLVRFQRGYQASARAMSTIDEMLDTLINRTGRVGL